jgi:hypothetical protein
MKNIKASFGKYLSAYVSAGRNRESRMGFLFLWKKVEKA